MKNLLFILLCLTGFKSLCTTPFSGNTLQQIVLKQLGIKETALKKELWTEKVLPYEHTQTVVVVPKIIGEDEGMFTLDAIIAVVDNQSGKIIQKSEKENTILSDAYFISGFTIDTAPYMVTKEIRAFGVRANYSGSSHANPSAETQLSLFVPNEKTLKCVLKNLVVESYSGEWDTECTGRFERVKSILLFQTQTSNNYFNLVVKERHTVIENEKINGECIEKTTDQPEKTSVLKYNGNRYTT